MNANKKLSCPPLFKTVIAGAMLVMGSVFASGQGEVKPLQGEKLLPLKQGAQVWNDRDYTLNALPEAFKDHRVLVQTSIERGARFEVFTPGYVVVITPVNARYNQAKTLIEAGFEYVDLEPFHPYLVRPDRNGQISMALQKPVQTGDVVSFGRYGIALWSGAELAVRQDAPTIASPLTIPTIDISGETHRHVIVAAGTEDIYQGHVDTVLMPDGKTMFAVWAINHAGHLGPLARSDDAGLTWEKVTVPDNWWEVGETTAAHRQDRGRIDRRTTPTIHRLVDPQGVERLFVFAGQNFPGRLRQAYSEDGGKTWTPMRDTGLAAECPPKSILSFDDGNRLVMWVDRRDPYNRGQGGERSDTVVFMSESFDGGLSWTPERVVVRVPTIWAQPAVIRSPDGQRAVMLMRFTGRGRSPLAVSNDGGETWSEAREALWNYTGDRPNMVYAPDGRIIAVFRDRTPDSPTAGHFVAWVGTFDDLFYGRDGQYRIKLMHSYAGADNAYSGLELLPDGTIVATNYIKYRPGPEKHSIVSTRFKLEELDAMLTPDP